MIYTIKANHHYDNRLFSSLPFIDFSPAIKRYVVFDTSCAYTLPAYNTEDVNKLFGLSFGFRGVHWNSARFGWRWSEAAQAIELLAYCYAEGVRNWDAQLRFPVVATVKPGEAVELGIEYDKEEGSYTFYAYTATGGFLGCESVKAPASLPWFGLTHSLYFGGELTAPHEMKVTMSKTVL